MPSRFLVALIATGTSALKVVGIINLTIIIIFIIIIITVFAADFHITITI